MLILIRINERFNWNLRIETIRHVDAFLCDYSKYEKKITNVKKWLWQLRRFGTKVCPNLF